MSEAEGLALRSFLSGGGGCGHSPFQGDVCSWPYWVGRRWWQLSGQASQIGWYLSSDLQGVWEPRRQHEAGYPGAKHGTHLQRGPGRAPRPPHWSGGFSDLLFVRLGSELSGAFGKGGELRAGVIAGTALPSTSRPQASAIEKPSLCWPCDEVTVEHPIMPARPHEHSHVGCCPRQHLLCYCLRHPGRNRLGSRRDFLRSRAKGGAGLWTQAAWLQLLGLHPCSVPQVPRLNSP